MTAGSYSVLAAAIVTVVTLLQLVRAIIGWPVTVGETWASGLPALIAARLAWLEFRDVPFHLGPPLLGLRHGKRFAGPAVAEARSDLPPIVLQNAC